MEEALQLQQEVEPDIVCTIQSTSSTNVFDCGSSNAC